MAAARQNRRSSHTTPEAGEVSGTVRSRARRSKSGCIICRSLKIKCDEKSPACGRCTRLQLRCCKPIPPVPLKQRRRGCGSWKSRESWQPPHILSVENSQRRDKTDAPLTIPDTVADNTSLCSVSSDLETTMGGGSNIDQVAQTNGSADGLKSWPSANNNAIERDITYTQELRPEQELLSAAPLYVPSDDMLLNIGGFPSPSATYDFTPWNLDTNSQLYDGQEDGDYWINLDPYNSLPSTNLLSDNQQHPGTAAAVVLDPQTSLPAYQHFGLQNNSLLASPSLHLAGSAFSSPLLCCTEGGISNRIYLTDLDHQALHFFCTRYSKFRIVKDFEWSLYSIILRMGSVQPMIMHFILATSLRGLLYSNRSAQTSRAAQAHLDEGLRILHGLLVESDHQDHLAVIISFWLLMLFATDRSAPMTGQQRRWLSSKIATYIKKHNIHSLWDQPSELEEKTYSQDANGSLLARVLSMIVYTDVQLNFFQHGSDLADLFLDIPSRIQTLRRVSQNFLELNHGIEYPPIELVHDMESIECYTVYMEQHRIYHKINKLFWHGLGDYDDLKTEIDALECKYSPFFKIANSICPSSAYTRLRFQIDAAVCEFYAIRLYCFRCKDQPLQIHIQDSVQSFLRIAYRVKTFNVRYSWFDRSLFIVGTEIEDQIRRDWVRDRILGVDLKEALERVWETETVKLERLKIFDIRRILSEEAGDRNDLTLNYEY